MKSLRHGDTERRDGSAAPQPSNTPADNQRAYEKPVLTEVPLESEPAVLGACRIIAIACETYRY